MLLNIIKYPNEKLRLKSEPIDILNIDKTFIEDLAYTMFYNKGLGISAIQVGRPEQIFLIDGYLFDRKDYVVFINPQIVETSKEVIISEEGCLSFPDVFIKIERPKSIKIEANDIHGERFDLFASGLLARTLCHEYDHITGKLFIDMANFLDKKRLKKVGYS